jgi:hypothetical protein
MLPADEGSCYESHTRYFFDRTKLTCLPFEFSGKFCIKQSLYVPSCSVLSN